MPDDVPNPRRPDRDPIVAAALREVFTAVVWTSVPFLWLLVMVFPMPIETTAPFSRVAGAVGVRLALCVLLVVLARRLPGMRTWSDVLATRPLPRHWPVGIAVVVTGALAYLTVQWLSYWTTAGLVQRFPGVLPPTTPLLPEMAIPDPTQIPSDLARAVGSGVGEEIEFAIAIAAGALAWRHFRARPGLLARILSVVVAAVPLAVTVTVRVLGHAYQGGAVIRVLPWLVGSWLILALCGTFWPLIIGHVLNNVLALVEPRLPDTHWVNTVDAVLTFAGAVALFALPFLTRSNRPVPQAWRRDPPTTTGRTGADRVTVSPARNLGTVVPQRPDSVEGASDGAVS